jgi:hypothetical protein
MLDKLRSLLGRKDAPAPPPRPPYAPYRDDAANAMYDLLFCDAPDAFRPKPGQVPAPWQAVLFGDPVRPDAVAALAGDGVRYINQTAKLAVFEGVESLRAATSALLAASQAVVDRIGPWDEPRLPPTK